MHRIGEEELQGPPLALRLLLQTRHQAPEPGHNLLAGNHYTETALTGHSACTPSVPEKLIYILKCWPHNDNI